MTVVCYSLKLLLHKHHANPCSKVLLQVGGAAGLRLLHLRGHPQVSHRLADVRSDDPSPHGSASCSSSAAGLPGGQEEAVPEGGSAGQAEEGRGAGQGLPPHRQEPGAPDGGGTRRHTCGHQHGEREKVHPVGSVHGAELRDSASLLQVPSPPGDEDEDFILVHHSDVQMSEKAEQVYAQLAQHLKEQLEVRPGSTRGTRGMVSSTPAVVHPPGLHQGAERRRLIGRTNTRVTLSSF